MNTKIVMTSDDGLHVTEGISGVWFYHLSNAGTNATALCGAKTMSTQIPISSWGVRGHLNESWCQTCAFAAADTLAQLGLQSEVEVSNPSIAEVQALDGKIFAMLTVRENQVLDFYRARGRKYGVAVSIISEADPDELARACSPAQADEILKRSNSRVHVATPGQ